MTEETLSAFKQALNTDSKKLVITTGRCDPRTGNTQPYQPFRQALELLSGDIETRWGGNFLNDGLSNSSRVVPPPRLHNSPLTV